MFLLMTSAQFSGAMFGILLTYTSLINSHAGSLDDINVPLTYAEVPTSEALYLLPQANMKWYNVFLTEMICTFLFVMINLIVKTRKTSPTLDGFLGCFAVALTLMAMIIVAADHTGGCLNPAVGFA